MTLVKEIKLRKIALFLWVLCPGLPVVAASDTLPPPVYGYAPDFSYEQIEKRYNALDLEIDIAFNERILAFINYFTVRNRDYTRKMLCKEALYLPLFEKYLKKHELPEELKYLPVIEAGLNPKAVSGSRAVGLWQFMRLTAREQGLKIDWYIDERMDSEKATEAACKYIKWLYEYFKDWKMTLAAYNCGIGNVSRAIRRSGYKKGFWKVYRYLPRETRSYVPQFAALCYAMEYADEHNLFVKDPAYPVPCEIVTTNQFIYLKAFAEESGIDLQVLKQLNPAIKKEAIPAHAKDYPLRIPKSEMENYRANKARILAKAKAGKTEFEKMSKNMPGSTFGREKVVYRVRSGDVLGKIARRHRVRLADLKVWNSISGSMIRIGQRLNIWIGPDYYSKTTRPQKILNQPIPHSKLHIVKSGDTLWDISRMYKGLTIDKIKQLNSLRSNNLKPGMQLRIG